MNNIGFDIVDQLIAEANSPIKTIVAIYPGRFQPMGKHHAEVFKWLQGKFGTQHTYIATTNKVQLPKSPFNFREKRSIMLKHGIKNIVQVKNPYNPAEILNKYDPKRTTVVIVRLMDLGKCQAHLYDKLYRPQIAIDLKIYLDGMIQIYSQ